MKSSRNNASCHWRVRIRPSSLWAIYACEDRGSWFWHMWEFEISTGRCLVDPKARVKTYPVVVEDGQIVVYADTADLPVQETDINQD